MAEKIQEKKQKPNMNNAFCGRVDDFKPLKKSFTDTKVKEYALVNKISETKEDGEVLLRGEAVVVNEYDLRKEVNARAKGQSLKEIVTKMQFQGLDPYTTIGQTADGASYDPSGRQPQTLGEALDKGLESDKFLAQFKPEELNNLTMLAKMDSKQLKEYFATIEAKQKVKEEGEKK